MENVPDADEAPTQPEILNNEVCKHCGVSHCPRSSWVFGEKYATALSVLAGSLIISATLLYVNMTGPAGAVAEEGGRGAVAGAAVNPLAVDNLKQYAKDLGINAENFEACLSNPEIPRIVGEDLSAGQSAGVTGTPSFFINGARIVGALPVAVFEGAIEEALKGNGPKPGTEEYVEVAARAGVPVIGSQDAPVTIVEFSDFECPFCGRFFKETYPRLKARYIDTGKVKIVFRHFPLVSIHPSASNAAIAAECASRQGKFAEYHDTLFEKMTSN
jgi:protein-disulfide isomerase